MMQNLFKRITLLLITIVTLCGIYPSLMPYAGNSLKVAYKSNNPYYAYEDADGNTVGLQVDIMNALAREMKLSAVEYYPIWDFRFSLTVILPIS